MSDLDLIIARLKCGEYDGADLMKAWINLRRIAELEAERNRLREALLNLNTAIDYHWNDSFTGVQRMPDAHAKMIVAAQQVAKQALEDIRKELENE